MIIELLLFTKYIGGVSMEFLTDGLTFINTLFLIIGFILIGIELTAPGLSAPGITGIICLLISVFLIADTITEGVILTFIIVTILGIMFFIAIKLISKGVLNNKLVLNTEESLSEIKEQNTNLSMLIGKEGTALTDLRPSGFVDIEGRRIEVMSNGRFINKTELIKAVDTKGKTLIVEPVRD